MHDAESEDGHHGDATGGFTDGTDEDTDDGAGASAESIFVFSTSEEFEGGCADEGAENDTGQAKEHADQGSDDGAGHASPGGAEAFGSIDTCDVVECESEQGQAGHGGEDEEAGAFISEHEAMKDGGSEDDGCTWECGEQAAEYADEHEEQGQRESDDLIHSHGRKVNQG